jgi:multiple antibiotic resistance protein
MPGDGLAAAPAIAVRPGRTPAMIEFALASFTALFVTVNPIKGATVFAVLIEGASRAEQRRIAARATLIASALLLVFTLFGDNLLRGIGISLAGVRVGGGILLMLLSIDIVFGRPIGAPSAAADAGGGGRADVSVFPLATPIIAGPAAITTVVVQATEAREDLAWTGLLLAAVGVTMLLTFGAFLIAARIDSWLGEAGMNVLGRVLGILLAALSAEMILAGLKQSGVFAS